MLLLISMLFVSVVDDMGVGDRDLLGDCGWSVLVTLGLGVVGNYMWSVLGVDWCWFWFGGLQLGV